MITQCLQNLVFVLFETCFVNVVADFHLKIFLVDEIQFFVVHHREHLHIGELLLFSKFRPLFLEFFLRKSYGYGFIFFFLGRILLRLSVDG